MSHIDTVAAGKPKMEKSALHHHHHHHHHNNNRLIRLNHTSFTKLKLWSLIVLALIYFFLFRSPSQTQSQPSVSDPSSSRRSLRTSSSAWEKRVRNSARPRQSSARRLSVLVTGAAGFVGSHVSTALRRRGDGVVGLDNFNDYYDPSLKRARQDILERAGVFVVDGDINDSQLLRRLFDVVAFTHVVQLAAQAGVRYAMDSPASYIHSNVAGLVSLLEACKDANPQPAVVWASSSSVYGLNTHAPFSESDPTDSPASLYAVTKKSGELIAHTYNHIYGLSITGLRFFTVYGPWGRPDIAYFFFTKDILEGNPISVYQEGQDGRTVARDFTYIDDVVQGCLAAVNTAGRSTGSGGKKKGEAPLRVFNLGNTSPVPVSDLVGTLEGLLNVEAKKNIVRLPHNGEVPFTHANISSAQAELGYHPTTDLRIGLKKFVRWYLNYYGDGTKEAS